MIDWLDIDPDHVLLVITEVERARLMREYCLDRRQVITVRSAPRALSGRHVTGLGVDNIDLIGWRDLLGLGCMGLNIDIVTEERH